MPPLALHPNAPPPMAHLKAWGLEFTQNPALITMLSN